MKIEKNLKHISLALIIFLLPFTDFLKNNTNEIDVILGKSFYFLVFVIFFFLFILTHIINFFSKNKDFSKTLLTVLVIYWLVFKHNSLKLAVNPFLDRFFSNATEISSEISLIILIILSIYISILIYRNNHFFHKFIFIFFYLSFLISLVQVFNFNDTSKEDEFSKLNTINFPDKLNDKKANIYFFILDGMQPIKEFEKYYKLNENDFLKYVENKNYKYIHNTINSYNNTTHSLSAFFYLDKIFDENGKLKSKSNIFYPSLLRNGNKPNLLNNLDNLGYDFKWIGNFFALCPKFNLKYCLNKNPNAIVDTYLYISFFRQSPLIQTIWSFGLILNFDFDRFIYFDVNNGMGRLTNYLSADHEIDKPTFYFVHHMSPHWPYLTNEDCSYKNYSGKKNIEGYRAAYICTLKKIKETIQFLDKFDPNSTVIFQSDHNWIMSKDIKEKKMIFNLIKIGKNCDLDKNINYNNVNTLRLIFSCMTGNNPKYIDD